MPTRYYATDGEGNVVGLMNASGQAVARYGYGPYGETGGGEVASDTGSTGNGLRFKAREQDARGGLVEMRAWWYDPESGRFVSEDPLGLAGGWNPYAFAGNDPVNFGDPFGTCRLMATVKFHYYSDGSVEAEILGYFWEGCDEQGGGGGGGSSSATPRKPPTQCEKMASVADALANVAPNRDAFARGFGVAVAGVNSWGRLRAHGVERIAAGDPGFKPQFSDGQLQARHFAGYVAAPTWIGIPASNFFAFLTERVRSGPGSSQADYDLAMAGIQLYGSLVGRSLSLSQVGDRIRKNVCQ